ncbi:MAG: LysM peptidoglycan-binding domain-containing protein [Lachnospiraceae bacterium]|jgi:LysM repeat protein|nr:LysM peptidoglycan-binding domain-containing protein [Lachnospiraceae bacterium]
MKKAGVTIAGVIASLTLFTSTAYAAEYTVARNDSLYKIGTLFDTTVDALITDNKLTSTTIYPGQVLDVPSSIYTVKRGDTLFLIAGRYGITLTSLRKANHKWDNLIIPGQKLLIPQGKAFDSSTPATPPSKAVIPYTEAEVDLLARLISAETRGEAYEAMVGVGAVVINRVQSPDWPSSISTVINHVAGGYYQFTPVENGTIRNAPTDDSVKAAWEALYGSDPSNGALFYFDDSSTNQWIWSKPQTARIDSMIFAK